MTVSNSRLRDAIGRPSGRQWSVIRGTSGRQLGVGGGKWETAEATPEQNGETIGRQLRDHICKTSGRQLRTSRRQHLKNPPTPAVSRGSASEEALLATRCQKGRRVCAERKPAPGGHEQGGSWQCRNAGKVKVWS